MAIPYLRASTIGAKQGSIVKAAAYRSGEKLFRSKTKEVANYNRKQGIADTDIMMLGGMPQWAKTRQSLYNAIEFNEKRKDARYGRELVGALPFELTLEQNRELVREFITEHILPLGMIADYAIHLPEKRRRKYKETREGEKFIDSKNIHVHILMTDRPIVNGEWAEKKNTDWNKKERIEAWRVGWQQVVNRKLEQAGFDERIDMRSYKRQGSEKQAQTHEGKTVTAFRRKQDFDKQEYSEIARIIDLNDRRKKVNQIVDDIEVLENLEFAEEQDNNSNETIRRSPENELHQHQEWIDSVNRKAASVQDSTEQNTNTSTNTSNSSKSSEDNSLNYEPPDDRRRWEHAEQPLITSDRSRGVADNTEREALTKAEKVRDFYKSTKNRKPKSAVNEYRLKLMELTANIDREALIRKFRQGSPMILNYERLIRDYLRRKGFSNTEINRAIRRASPAVYKKSREYAQRYARRLNDFMRNQQRKHEQEQQQKRQQKQEQTRRKNQQKRRRF